MPGRLEGRLPHLFPLSQAPEARPAFEQLRTFDTSSVLRVLAERPILAQDGQGDLHSVDDLPSSIDRDPDANEITATWHRFGHLHRDGDRPAVVCLDQTSGNAHYLAWYTNGKREREQGGPTSLHLTYAEWHEGDEGLAARSDGPAIVNYQAGPGLFWRRPGSPPTIGQHAVALYLAYQPARPHEPGDTLAIFDYLVETAAPPHVQDLFVRTARRWQPNCPELPREY